MKRIVSLFCALCLVVYLVPFAVSADTVTIVASGTCGTTAYWKLTSDNVLTIYGSGDMRDRKNEYDMWSYSLIPSIKTIIVEEGITSIGANVFRYWYPGTSSSMVEYSGLESIHLPSTLETIGNYAFSCFSLPVTLPDGLKTIGTQAFYAYKGESLSIPDSVASIGQSAFAHGNLRTVYIGSGVTSIGASAFADNPNLTTVQVRASSPPVAGGNMFGGCPDSLQIYVPDPYSYEAAEGWANYAAWIVGGNYSDSTGGEGTENAPLYIQMYGSTSVNAGMSVCYSANLVGVGEFDPSMVFALNGAESPNTTLAAELKSGGYYTVTLSVSSYETAETLVIAMASVADPSIRANATITVKECLWEDSLESSEPTTPTLPQVDNSEVLGAISDMENNLMGDNSVEDELINSDIDEQNKEFDENMSILDAMTMPTYNDIDTEFEDILNDEGGDGITLAAKFFQIIFDNELIYIVFFIAFILALISYVIFGRR